MRLLPRLSVAAVLLTGVCLAPSASGAGAAELPPDWAFRRFTRPTVPPSAYANPIDAFLAVKLAGKGLRFAPEADRRTLIRRLSLDLLGLPPTPEDVEAFVADPAPDAYEKLVEKYLAAPQFGERQAVWWLDVVRFAESDGFRADDPRPHAWRYRDYVIRSFNADKPFDRFVKEQLAGDELYPGDADALVATGFLRHFPYEFNAVDVELKRQDMLNDLTDTTAAAFLGITIGCARCHDHKTDPVTQEDYYRLQAFFAGFWPVEVPLATAAERADYERKLAAWLQRTAELRAAIDELERPVREKVMLKERARFPEEYARLLDVPPEQRTPLEAQLARLVGLQVYKRTKVTAAQIRPADRDRWEGLSRQLAAWETERPPELPTAMAMTDLPVPPPTRLLKRGNWRTPAGRELSPGFIAAIDDRDAEVTPTGRTPGRRAALARWIASRDNPLTGRVIVNRLWQHHFGTGLVATPGDLGATGERPTHPELLDWLAVELIDHGWSLKHIHRLIVTSRAYRQTARSDAGATADPGNTLLWKFPRRRLDGETLRDALLAVAGRLNLKAGGPSVFPELPPELLKTAPQWKVTPDPAERDRRSVYVFVKRNLRYPLFALFDAPDRVETCSRRFTTTTAPQALTLLNDPVVLGLARSFAARVTKEAGTDPARVVDRAFRIALGRPPSTEEHAVALAFLEQHPTTAAEALTDLCHALVNLNEFLYVD